MRHLFPRHFWAFSFPRVENENALLVSEVSRDDET